MINKLKQKINELRWSLNNLQHGTIQRGLYHELFDAFDIIDKEDDEMMHTMPKENTMNIENKECQIYISCDDKRMFDDLHEAVDEVLKKYSALTENYSADILIESDD